MDIFACIKSSKDKLCVITYRGANIIKPKWYLVQVDLVDSSDSQDIGVYFVKLFHCHPYDCHKPQDCARYRPDWYEIQWTDKTQTVFDYGKDVLVRPTRSP